MLETQYEMVTELQTGGITSGRQSLNEDRMSINFVGQPHHPLFAVEAASQVSKFGGMTGGHGEVTRIASHDAPTASASTSFESMRLTNAAASGPRAATNPRGRRYTAPVAAVGA